jgi:hypothetical protein
MKNQYVGDINDFRKYGLIDLLGKVFGGKILFVWMLTRKDDDNGNKVEYLNNPQKYRQFNHDLFDVLKEIVSKKQSCTTIENIIALEKNKLFQQYNFINDIVLDGSQDRNKYFEKVYKAAEGNDLIFLDPDNGIEIRSCKYGTKKSSKYIFWNEIIHLYNMDKDILFYQHFPRINHRVFTKNIIDECNSKLNGAKIIPLITQNALFVFITKKYFKIKQLHTELKRWKGEMEIFDINHMFKSTISDVSTGYSMYTIPSDTPESELKKITESNIKEMKLSSKEIQEMGYCNLVTADLNGCYYDKCGNIYIKPGLQFTLRIKYFNKIYIN